MYGAERMLIELCKEQTKRKLTPTIISFGRPNEPEKLIEKQAVKNNIRVIKVRCSFIQAILYCLRIGRDNSYNLIHSHGYKFNIPLGLATPLRKTPVVSTVHGYVAANILTKMYYYQLVDKFALSLIDAVIFVSEHQSKTLNIGKSNLSQVINNGISENPLTIAPSQPTDNATRRILAVGRLAKEKNFHELIIAISILNIRDSNKYVLTIAGDGYLHEKLIQLASDENNSNVIFLGYSEKVNDLLNENDCLVISSTTEGLPICLLESMRNGTGIISTKAGGIPDALGENYPFYIEHPSADSIAQAIEDYFSSTERIAVIERSKIRFFNHFTSRAMARKYESLYKRLLTERSQ